VSELFGEGRSALLGYRTLKIGLLPERDALYERLDVRCAEMFEGGLVEEVRHILSLGFPPASKPFESHGYKQALQLLQGELNPREALFYARRNTRNYAKRQITWFRREVGLEWLKGFGDAPEIRALALERVASFLI
jgi:tRNA dimethylallyltransferase